MPTFYLAPSQLAAITINFTIIRRFTGILCNFYQINDLPESTTDRSSCADYDMRITPRWPTSTPAPRAGRMRTQRSHCQLPPQPVRQPSDEPRQSSALACCCWLSHYCPVRRWVAGRWETVPQNRGISRGVSSRRTSAPDRSCCPSCRWQDMRTGRRFGSSHNHFRSSLDAFDRCQLSIC